MSDNFLNTRLEKLEKELKLLSQNTKESSTRNVSFQLSEEIKQILNQFQLDEWNKQKPPELVVGNSNRSSFSLTNQDSPNVNDVTNALRSLYGNFQFYTSVGPFLISILSPCRDFLENSALNSCSNSGKTALRNIADRLLNHHKESGSPQVAIMGGVSGSGKSFNAVQLVRCLIEQKECSPLLSGLGDQNGVQSKVEKLMAYHQCISLLTTCSAVDSEDSSKLGTFYELQLGNAKITQIKFHHVFLNQTRLVEVPRNETNYHIFYAIIAGLTDEQLLSLHLPSRDSAFYRYLSSDLIGTPRLTFDDYRKRYQIWSEALEVMNINEVDILKVLSAIILLGNIPLSTKNSNLSIANSQSISFDEQIQTISELLGVAKGVLVQNLSGREVNLTRSPQMVRFQTGEDVADLHNNCDNLAQALYARVVLAIIKRGNSFNKYNEDNKLSISESITKSPGLGYSNFGGFGLGKQQEKQLMGSFQRTLSFQSAQLPLNQDGNFVGVLDLFGPKTLSDPNQKLNRLENLCVNLCAETIEYFFKTHAFKNVIEHHREELNEPIRIEYYDNGPVVDLISSQKSGILAVFDRAVAEKNPNMADVTRSFDENPGYAASHSGSTFIIEHYTEQVVYDAESLISDLEAKISEDMVSMFSPSQCTFQFATHLFSNELKILEENSKRGKNNRNPFFRLTPVSGPEVTEGQSLSFCQDFHFKLDSLLKVLVRSKPTFIRCLKTDNYSFSTTFNASFVAEQCFHTRLPQLITTVREHLIHKMRYKNFAKKFEKITVNENVNRILSVEEKSNQIISIIERSSPKVSVYPIRCVTKRKHVFFSDSFLQQAEFCMSANSPISTSSMSKPNAVPAAKSTAIVEPQYRENFVSIASKPTNVIPRHTRISTTSSSDDKPTLPYQQNSISKQQSMRNSFELRQKFNQLNKVAIPLEASLRPQLPINRSYSIVLDGARKLSYPHMRVMVENFPSPTTISTNQSAAIPVSIVNSGRNFLFSGTTGGTTSGNLLIKGDVVQAIGSGDGVSSQGRIAVIKDGTAHHVPFAASAPN